MCRECFGAWEAFGIVRLNLFNHVLALFRTKFACNLAIRYLVFKWELCKGCVWVSVKKFKNMCIWRFLATRSRKWLATGNSTKCHTCEACRKLKGHDSWSTTGQKVQSGQTVISRLKLVTYPTRETESPNCLIWMKTDFSHSSHTLL